MSAVAPVTKLLQRRKITGAQANLASVTIGTYATGGVSVTPQQLGITAPGIVMASPAAGYVFEYDYTNEKLKAYQVGAEAGAMSEVANATNMTTVTTRVLGVGI